MPSLLLDSRWLDRLMAIAVLLACAVALSLNVADPDLWGHVQYGRDALLHGLPATTTYSYVAEGYPWINHEILTEYALAIVSNSLGGPGLLTIKCLLGLAVVGTIFWRARGDGASLLAACSLCLLIAVTLGSHWSLRPQLASYTCFALLLALLSYCFHGWEGQDRFSSLPRRTSVDPLAYSVARLKWLWLAVPLFAVWTNSHGGFLAGLCVFLAYLAFRGVEAVIAKGRSADGLVLRLGMMGIAATLATFLNPYGPNFHRWLFDDLKVPRPEIVEWRAPEFFNAQFLPFWLLVGVSIAAIALSRRQRDWTLLTLLGLILWQALSHHRHIAFFAIACGWWLPAHFDSALARLGIGSDAATGQSFLTGFSRRMQQAFAVLLIGAIGISTVQLARRVTTLKVGHDTYPVAAFDYIARRGLTGKMVCTFNWSQYALAAFGPREAGQPGILVHIDGRCRTSYSQEMLDTHFDFLLGNVGPDMRYRDPKSGPFDPIRVLSAGRPDLVLISRQQLPSVEVMQSQQDGWVLLYQDALAQLWGRASRYDDPQSAYYVPPGERHIGDAPQIGYSLWPALPAYRPLSTKIAHADRS